MNEYKFPRERWKQLTFIEQMGNIGAEVGRAIIAHRNGNEMRKTRAIDRAIDLFSATIEVNIGIAHSCRLREVFRARDEFLRLFFDNTFDNDAANIERYFMDFAYIARAEKTKNKKSDGN